MNAYRCYCPDSKQALDREAIRRVIRSHLKEVKFCYERQLLHDENLQGRVAVAFTVMQSGKVANSAVKSSTLSNSSVENCIANAVGRWEFPASLIGITEVTYPFVLKSAGD